MPLPQLLPTETAEKAEKVTRAPRKRWSEPRPEVAWAVLGDLGAVLALIGAVDLLLTWYPLAFGNPEWEFGTVTSTLDSLPVLALGLGMVLAAILQTGNRRPARGIAVVFGLLGVAVLAAALLYATDIPLALRAVSDPVMSIGLHRAVVKTMVQGLAYPPVFFWIAYRSWK